MNLDVYNTHMELYPYTKDQYPVIEDMYVAVDKYTDTEYACGYLIEDGKLYLPRGTSISKIEYITGVTANYIQESDPIEKMERTHYSLYDPRNELQEKAVEHLTSGDHQLSLTIKTGMGKTFCVAYASTKLNEKTLIITPNEALKQQWISTYNKMFDYRPKNLMNIAGSNVMDAIMDDLVDPADVYFVNHQTLRSYLAQHNSYQLRKFFRKLNIGIKVYDESHMEFSNILLMDFFSNTNRTWYLTATFDRSDKSESVCFKRAFSSVEEFGYRESEEITRKHVIYHIVNINSHITPKDRGRVQGYRGLTSQSYGKYAFFDDKNQTAYKAILMILEKLKDVEGKTLIFVPLIDAIDDVVKKLKVDFPDKSVAAFHSKIPKDEKESAEKKDIIVSTIKSCGTGRDIKGLRSIICVDAIASKVVIEQVIGRLRPYADDKDTFYFDIVDRCIPTLNYWHRARYRKIETLVKATINLNMD
jgi:superfamily II DNA or RNA helicase